MFSVHFGAAAGRISWNWALVVLLMLLLAPFAWPSSACFEVVAAGSDVVVVVVVIGLLADVGLLAIFELAPMISVTVSVWFA